jgi:hypothetical protein
MLLFTSIRQKSAIPHGGIIKTGEIQILVENSGEKSGHSLISLLKVSPIEIKNAI